MQDFEHLDHYELLGIARAASADEIRRAYRQQMSRYHPDRYANAPPEERAYVNQRAARINQAYQVLTDFPARSAYNRSLPPVMPRREPPVKTTAPRPVAQPSTDRQAELYGQARNHFHAQRYAPAVAALRELQQINPFYRDSATLLSQAERALEQQSSARSGTADKRRRSVFVAGASALAVVALLAAGLWWRSSPQQQAAGLATTATADTIVAPPPTTAPASTTPSAESVAVVAVEPTTTPVPSATTVVELTAVPTTVVEPTAVPTIEATAEPSVTSIPASPTIPAPSATLEVVPSPVPASPTSVVLASAEEGPLVFSEPLPQGWAVVQGQNNAWSVGYVGGAYQITAQPGVGNIWSYNASPAGVGFSIAVDVETQESGAAGLLLHYSDPSNYLAFFVNQQEGSFRLEQRVNGRIVPVAASQSAAVKQNEQQPNRLRAVLSGNQVALFINEQPVETLTLDSPAPSPLYGMIAVAQNERTVALFRNLEMRALP